MGETDTTFPKASGKAAAKPPKAPEPDVAESLPIGTGVYRLTVTVTPTVTLDGKVYEKGKHYEVALAGDVLKEAHANPYLVIEEIPKAKK